MTTLRVIRRLLGGGWRQQCIISKVAIISKVFCHQQLCRLSLSICCSDQLLSSYFGTICWDCLLRSPIEIIYEINCRDYLWRSALESICWDPCSRLALSVEINSWYHMLKSVVEIVWQYHLLRLEIEIISWGQMMRLCVEINCWNHLLRSTCKISCKDYLWD